MSKKNKKRDPKEAWKRYSRSSCIVFNETTPEQAGEFTALVKPKGAWHEIYDHGDPEYGYGKQKCVFRIPWVDGEETTPNGNHPEIEREYERLIREAGYVPPTEDPPSPLNVVEMCAGSDEQSQAQPCFYGNLVEHHAVYCHNEVWLYAPRKCRRTWYTGGETRDEDCPGYKPNPNYKPVSPSARKGEGAE